MRPELVSAINAAITSLVDLITSDEEVDGEVTAIIVSKYNTIGTSENFCVSMKVSHPSLGTEPSFFKYSMYIDAETLHTECDSTWA